MALLDDILSWTETKLPAWQRDAARRLFQQGDELTNSDYDDLYVLLKAAYGLPNPLGLTPEPLNSTHLPAVMQAGETVILKAMRDLKYVNRIAPGQKLNFAPSGITVIYGGNGSGKSGYTRVMKRACRARDQAEKVLPDAQDPTSHLHIPEGTFDIEIGGTPKPLKWKADSVSPDELSSIAVFDCHCARAYLTTEQDVTYLPYGLDVVENLANKVLPELSRRLDIDISCVSVDRLPFNHLVGETEVGRLISVLNETTDPIKIKSLGTLSQLEIRRIAELETALSEADPYTKAIELRLSAGRIKELVGRIDTALPWVSKEAITTLKELDESAISAVQAENLAAEALQSGEALLPGTGEQVWKALFDAARKFSKEVAYPEHDFPHTSEGALCPLCQQPLNDAGDRLKRFNEYIQKDVAKTATKKKQEVETEKTKIERADLSLGLDKPLAGELALLDETIVSLVNAFQTSIENSRVWMLSAIDSHDWDSTPDINENPRHRLRNLAARQLYSARTFAKAVDENKKKLLSAEHEELRARKNLSGCLEALLALVDRMKKRGEFESCKKDLKTKPISDKSKEFASSAVTATLKKALDDEFKALGIGHIKTKLKDRNEKGKIMHQLLLDLPTNNKLEQILSEGEQRAIALGSFLAELKLSKHNGAIVFDDPVSSLDHKRRRKLSKRLALESKRRQVLVFTHDVVFLHQLLDECDKLNKPPSVCFLEANGGFYGNVSEGLPWGHKRYKERIDCLEKAQKRFEKLPWPIDPSEELSRQIIQQYSFFRATIERVVQDFVLNATVQRFKDYVDVKKLEKVVGLEQSEVDEIFRLNQRCNDLVEAHDPSSAKDETPPTADELKRDIKDLKALIQRIENRRTGQKA